MQTNLTPRTDKAAFREKAVRGEPVTAQEVFDVAVEGVILQGGPSVSDRACVYRARNGRECAAGQVIPDAFYHPAMEGKKIEDMVDRDAPVGTWLIPYVLRKHSKLMGALQDLHDSTCDTFGNVEDSAFLKDFKRRAALLAHNLGLTVPPLAQIEEPSGAPG